MDCGRFEDLLFARLGAQLDAADATALDEHVRNCASCRRLRAVLRQEAVPPEEAIPAVPADFLAGVVAGTSGSACARVVRMLAESVDSPLDARGTLLSAHLDACPDCAAFARVLTRLRVELPQLASVDPGEAFTTDVLAATSGRERAAPAATTAPSRPPSPRASGARTFTDRLEAAWARLVRRPRLALEGAYAAALLLFLVVGLPSTSVAELPVRAFDELRQETARVEQAVSSGIGAAIDQGRVAFTASAASAARYLTSDERASALRAAAVQTGVRAWIGVAGEMATGIWRSILGPFAERVEALWSDPSDDITSAPSPDRNP